MATGNRGVGYLQRTLAMAVQPFAYRSRVRALFGLPTVDGPKMNFATPLPVAGFRYFIPRFSADFEFPDERPPAGSAKGEVRGEGVAQGNRREFASLPKAPLLREGEAHGISRTAESRTMTPRATETSVPSPVEGHTTEPSGAVSEAGKSAVVEGRVVEATPRQQLTPRKTLREAATAVTPRVVPATEIHIPNAVTARTPRPVARPSDSAVVPGITRQDRPDTERFDVALSPAKRQTSDRACRRRPLARRCRSGTPPIRRSVWSRDRR